MNNKSNMAGGGPNTTLDPARIMDMAGGTVLMGSYLGGGFGTCQVSREHGGRDLNVGGFSGMSGNNFSGFDDISFRGGYHGNYQDPKADRQKDWGGYRPEECAEVAPTDGRAYPNSNSNQGSLRDAEQSPIILDAADCSGVPGTYHNQILNNETLDLSFSFTESSTGITDDIDNILTTSKKSYRPSGSKSTKRWLC
jgi:hypothetical protein